MTVKNPKTTRTERDREREDEIERVFFIFGSLYVTVIEVSFNEK